MIKVFVTGDNHFGKKYDRYADVREVLIQSRFDALDRMVKKADEEDCCLFIITGDLFDNINTIKVSDVRKIIDILCAFSGSVLILPGNHDYYTGNEKLWRDFENILAERDHSIILLKEFRRYDLLAGEERIAIYPAPCQFKHSKENNLKWIKESEMDEGYINLGLAHGAISGITPDMKEEYFLMKLQELEAIPVDAWFIGHTHIPYPDLDKQPGDSRGYRIFNAGTHEQTDLHNNTDGYCFIISIEKKEKISKVFASKFRSGKIKYYDLALDISARSGLSLKDEIDKKIKDIDDNSIVRLKISGSISQAEYLEKEMIYKSCLGRFLSYEKDDRELSEEITVEKIRTEYAETSFAAQFMEALVDNPTELQMAYDLLQECREG